MLVSRLTFTHLRKSMLGRQNSIIYLHRVSYCKQSDCGSSDNNNKNPGEEYKKLLDQKRKQMEKQGAAIKKLEEQQKLKQFTGNCLESQKIKLYMELQCMEKEERELLESMMQCLNSGIQKSCKKLAQKQVVNKKKLDEKIGLENKKNKVKRLIRLCEKEGKLSKKKVSKRGQKWKSETDGMDSETHATKTLNVKERKKDTKECVHNKSKESLGDLKDKEICSSDQENTKSNDASKGETQNESKEYGIKKESNNCIEEESSADPIEKICRSLSSSIKKAKESMGPHNQYVLKLEKCIQKEWADICECRKILTRKEKIQLSRYSKSLSKQIEMQCRKKVIVEMCSEGRTTAKSGKSSKLKTSEINPIELPDDVLKAKCEEDEFIEGEISKLKKECKKKAIKKKREEDERLKEKAEMALKEMCEKKVLMMKFEEEARKLDLEEEAARKKEKAKKLKAKLRKEKAAKKKEMAKKLAAKAIKKKCKEKALQMKRDREAAENKKKEEARRLKEKNEAFRKKGAEKAAEEKKKHELAALIKACEEKAALIRKEKEEAQRIKEINEALRKQREEKAAEEKRKACEKKAAQKKKEREAMEKRKKEEAFRRKIEEEKKRDKEEALRKTCEERIQKERKQKEAQQKKKEFEALRKKWEEELKKKEAFRKACEEKASRERKQKENEQKKKELEALRKKWEEEMKKREEAITKACEEKALKEKKEVEALLKKWEIEVKKKEEALQELCAEKTLKEKKEKEAQQKLKEEAIKKSCKTNSVLDYFRSSLYKSLNQQDFQPGNKVSIIGAGAAGTACAITLLAKGVTNNVAIYDNKKDLCAEEQESISHGSLFLNNCSIDKRTSVDCTKDSRVVVVTTGVRIKANESRLQVAQQSADILKKVMPELVEQSPKAVFIIIANPADVMTWVARKVGNLPSERCFSTGCHLDTARFRMLIAKAVRVSTSSVYGFVVGEHGDHSVPLWSSVTIGGTRLHEMMPNIGTSKDPMHWSDVHKDVVRAAYKVIAGKGYTNWAIGLTVTDIVSAIFENSNRILSLSTNVNGMCGFKDDIFLSLPCIVNQCGLHGVIHPQLSDWETEMLKNTAKVLLDAQKSLKI